MKSISKKVFVIMIVSVMVVCCFGCGKSESKKEASKETKLTFGTAEPTTLPPTTTAFVPTSNKVTIGEFKQEAKSVKGLHLKHKGNQYIQKDYSGYSMGTPCDVYIYTDGKGSINKIKIKTTSGSIKGLKAMGDTSVLDTIVGVGRDDPIPLDESEGDPRTGVYHAGWNYEPILESFFDVKNMKGCDDVKPIDMAKGKTVNGWKIKAKEASGDGFTIVLKKVKKI